jgi:hypothetical protein
VGYSAPDDNVHTEADRETASLHVAAGEARVTRQIELVAELRAKGLPTAQAVRVLEAMEVSLDTMRRHLAEIEHDPSSMIWPRVGDPPDAHSAVAATSLFWTALVHGFLCEPQRAQPRGLFFPRLPLSFHLLGSGSVCTLGLFPDPLVVDHGLALELPCLTFERSPVVAVPLDQLADSPALIGLIRRKEPIHARQHIEEAHSHLSAQWQARNGCSEQACCNR